MLHFTSAILSILHCILCFHCTIDYSMNMHAVEQYPNVHSPALVGCRIKLLQKNCYWLSNLVIWICFKSVSTHAIVSQWHCKLGIQIVSSTSEEANAQAYSPWYHHISNNSSFRQKHPGVPESSDRSDRTSYPLPENYTQPVAQAMGHIAYVPPLLCGGVNAPSEQHVCYTLRRGCSYAEAVYTTPGDVKS